MLQVNLSELAEIYLPINDHKIARPHELHAIETSVASLENLVQNPQLNVHQIVTTCNDIAEMVRTIK